MNVFEKWLKRRGGFKPWGGAAHGSAAALNVPLVVDTGIGENWIKLTES